MTRLVQLLQVPEPSRKETAGEVTALREENLCLCYSGSQGVLTN